MCPHACAPPQRPGAASVAPETATEIPQLSALHLSPSAGETIRTSTLGGDAPPTPASDPPAPPAPIPPDWSIGPHASAMIAAPTLSRRIRTARTLGPGSRNGSAPRPAGGRRRTSRVLTSDSLQAYVPAGQLRGVPPAHLLPSRVDLDRCRTPLYRLPAA